MTTWDAKASSRDGTLRRAAARRDAEGDRSVIDVSTILFDFFGTLVTYEPDRSRLEYPVTHGMARSLGYRWDHDHFVMDWHAASSTLEATTAESHAEFSMTDAAHAFAQRSGLELSERAAVDLGARFVDEWQQHVIPVPGAADMLRRLAASYRLGIVSNTHDPAMVPSMLDSMGIADVMSIVLLSVEHGYRKPHPSIYARCLDQLQVSPGEVLFVGDSYAADYDAPRRAGMHALLISDTPPSAVPPAHRLRTVVDTESVLPGRT